MKQIYVPIITNPLVWLHQSIIYDFHSPVLQMTVVHLLLATDFSLTKSSR